jgi:hypothetical protein
VKHLNMGFFFLLKVLGRAILEFVLDKNGPGMLRDTDSHKSIPIGFHTVKETVPVGASKKEN